MSLLVLSYRLVFDKVSGGRYIYLPPYVDRDMPRGAVKSTVDITDALHLDLDGNGRVIGIEYLATPAPVPMRPE